MVEYIIPMLEMKVFLPEDMIIRQGEEGREMYFISTGDCIVYVKDTRRHEQAVRRLERGDFFGVRVFLLPNKEIAVCSNCRRTATVKSKNYCVTAKLCKNDFNEVVQRFPDLYEKLKAHSRRYRDD